ncbi:MAG: twin-arginine translocation signal domain-containing protein [Faecalibacterium prausnitzii]
MGEKFSRRDFLKGMAVVTASGLLVACGGGNGTPVKLAFVAMDNFYDQDETPNGYVLCQGFQVKNLSASDITLDGLLDFETYDKKESKVGVEKAIRELAGSSKTITAKTSAGAVTSIAVLDPASSKTLKPGESAKVWFFAIAPNNETTLDILYQGVHQCYLSYGKDLPSHEPGGGGSSSASSTVSSSSATSESASTSTAASEVGVMESPSSVDREASASR